MVSKLFLLTTFTLATVNAQGAFQFKETYPQAGSIPTAKPEWLDLIKSAKITAAPVVQSVNGAPQQQGSSDPYCDWTFTGCFAADDLYQCPKGQWAPTYDDGPSEFSPKLYDELDKTNTKATFFMVGGQVVKFPQHVQRAFKAGHELALHTWSHSHLTTLTNEQIVAELKWTELAIKEVTGVSPKLFRPPYGDIDNRVRDVAKALGFTAVIWNHDTNDWASTSSHFDEKWIDGNVTAWANDASKATVGGISLEHDLYDKTVNAAIRVLPILGKAYQLKTVGACTGHASYKDGNGAQASPGSTGSNSGTVTKSSTVSPSGATSNANTDSKAQTQLSTNGATATASSLLGLSVAIMAAAALA